MFTKYDETLDLFDHFFTDLFFTASSGQVIIHKNKIKEYLIWQLAIYFRYTLDKHELES